MSELTREHIEAYIGCLSTKCVDCAMWSGTDCVLPCPPTLDERIARALLSAWDEVERLRDIQKHLDSVIRTLARWAWGAAHAAYGVSLVHDDATELDTERRAREEVAR